MVDHEREHMTQLVVEALQRAGQRGVLLGGWSDLGDADLPDSILAADFIPHDWLFPKMAAVVHHGGAGTTAAGLRAGIPTVVVSFFGDQPFWGWRVYELGAGPKWIPRTNLTADNLASAIRQAVGDQGIKDSASMIGVRIRAEDGVNCAINLIGKMSGETGHLEL
jgi:sterol 3beta-glucosyltransferase